MTKTSKLAKMLRPHLAQAQDAGGGGMSVHELSGPLHTGVLSQSQAPWATTQASFLAHVNDPAAHHEPVSAGNLIGVLGQTVSIQAGSAAHQVMMTNPTTFAAEWRNLSSLAGSGLQTSGGQLLVGAGPGITVDSTAVGLTTPGTLSVSSTNSASGSHTHAISSSSNPGAVASLLSTDASGHLTLVRLNATDRLRTPLLDSASGHSLTIFPALDLILSPGSGLVRMGAGRALQASSYASQATGWRITDAGEGDFRYLFADELHAKSFIADLEQALAGGQIIAKSVAVVATDFTLPAAGSSATLRVRDLPSAPNMAVFQSGDFVGLRQFSRSGGELVVAWAWGTVSSYADGTGAWEGTQTWTFTRHSSTPGSASGVIPADALALDFGVSGNGYYEVNAIDGIYGQNSPYAQVVTWSNHPATRTVRARFGNLRGITNVANEFGLFAGSGTGVSDRYIRASSSAVELRNVPLQLFDGATATMQLSAGAGNNAPSFAMGSPLPTAPLSNDSGAWMGLSGGQYQFRVGSVAGGTLQQGLHWDGSTLNVRGQIVATSGSSGYANLADRPNSLYGINPAEHARLTTGRLAFLETWDGDNPLDHWEAVQTGAGELTIITSAAASMGGKYLRVGDNTGDDQRYLVHRRAIPFSSFKLYRFRMRVRRAAGSGALFAGFVGVGSDGATLVNASGSASYSSQHYFCALNAQPTLNAWTEYVGLVQGWGASAAEYGSVNKAHPSVRYMRPAFIVNSQNAAGVYDIDYFQIEEFDWPGPAGLYLTPLHLGYWDGTNWRSYIDNNGNFYFGGSTGAHIRYDSSLNRLFGRSADGVTQWYADGGTGELFGGAGSTKIARHGFYAQIAPDAPGVTWPLPFGGLHVFTNLADSSTALSSLVMTEPPAVYSGSAPRIRSWIFYINQNKNYVPPNGPPIRYYTPPTHAVGIMYNDSLDIIPIWHAENDGHASGLDADLLDGLHAAAFAQLSGAAFTGNLSSTSTIGTSWSALTLATGWQNAGGGWASAAASAFGDWVMIKGVVSPTSNQSANATILTLPTALRPSENRRFATAVGTTTAQLDVLSTGVVRVNVAVNAGVAVSIECVYKK